ncbi:SMI1/KNR4 family protein [Streptomyces sp. AA1529]|uniref:SMI1/KNR4 family protein n=1 Tax=Streptomyces sp. AA1529 TaxID=1203257 RepID=UPI003D763F72
MTRHDIERLTAAWARADAWLAEHAPGTAGLLRPGASDEQIRAAEDATGRAFPPELAAWYRIHDGMEHRADGMDCFLPRGASMLTLEELVSANAFWHESAYADGDVDEDEEADLLRLPFAQDEDRVQGWYVDSRPEVETFGGLNTWFLEGDTAPYPGYPTWESWPLHVWVEEIAACLEQGRPFTLPAPHDRTEGRPALAPGGFLVWGEEDAATPLDGPR